MKPGRVFMRIAAACAAVILAAVFYVAVVVISPEAAEEADAEQTLPAPAASVVLSDISQLQGLISSFPVSVLSAAGGSLTLTYASAYDAAFENGVGRINRLIYQTDDGMTVQVDSIYPARALKLMDGKGYTLTGSASVRVAGAWAVRMDSKTGIRLHAQTSEGLYVVTVPQSAEKRLAEIVSALRLSK